MTVSWLKGLKKHAPLSLPRTSRMAVVYGYPQEASIRATAPGTEMERLRLTEGQRRRLAAMDRTLGHSSLAGLATSKCAEKGERAWRMKNGGY